MMTSIPSGSFGDSTLEGVPPPTIASVAAAQFWIDDARRWMESDIFLKGESCTMRNVLVGMLGRLVMKAFDDSKVEVSSTVIGFLLLNMHLHVCWCLHSIINSVTALEQFISFLISKHSALFEIPESFLTTKSPEGLRASQLACRFVLIYHNNGGCLGKQPLHPQS
uniref:Stromal antigen n=1 Tax=Solanum tuberosum TaxID=4113 RepID=M1BFE9_SOLTU